MLIVRLAAEENGAIANQTIYPALDTLPEGWVQIPEELEDEARSLLPWLTLELDGGAVVAVADNAQARSAAQAQETVTAGAAE